MGSDDYQRLVVLERNRRIRDELPAEMIQRLVRHAMLVAHALQWRSAPGGDVLPKGLSPEGIVSQAIVKLLQGRNSSPPNLNIMKVLWKNIRRDIVHLARSAENRLVVESIDEKPEVESLFKKQPNPREILMQEEEEARFRRKILSHIGNDSELRQVCECIFDGITTPKEIAQALHFSRDQAKKAKRRLRYRLDSYYRAR